MKWIAHMAGFKWFAALTLTAAVSSPHLTAAADARPDRSKLDDPVYCSNWLAEHGDGSLPAADHRHCIIAIASTYIDAEENSIPPEKQLFADDVSRHRIGTPTAHAPGNAAKIIADHGHDVIGKIANRQWAVDGNQAWILYDGYLKADPAKPEFFVSERLTIEKGLIREILVTAVARAS